MHLPSHQHSLWVMRALNNQVPFGRDGQHLGCRRTLTDICSVLVLRLYRERAAAASGRMLRGRRDLQ